MIKNITISAFADIMLLTISAILCGADNWGLVQPFGKTQLEWLKGYGSFANGAPSLSHFKAKNEIPYVN